MIANNIKLVHNLTSALLGLMGFTLFVAPDYFWNPENGKSPFKFVRETNISSDHFDGFTVSSFRGAGAVLFGTFLVHFLSGPLLLLKEGHVKAFLRFKLVLLLGHMALFAHMAFRETSPTFVKEFFVAIFNIKMAAATAIIWVLQNGSLPKESRATTTRGKQRSALFGTISVAYVLPFALSLIFKPSLLAPGGKLSFHAHEEQPSIDGVHALHVFASRLEGVGLMTCVLTCKGLFGWNCLDLGRRNIVIPFLYESAFIINALTSRTSIKTMYVVLLFLHGAYVLFAGELVRVQEKADTWAKEDIVKGEHSTVPDLAPEGPYKKLS